MSDGYKLVQLVNGSWSVHSIAEKETFHPVIGPVAEAEALYVKQLRLRERVSATTEEFVVWDVGLGAAANVLTVLGAIRDLDCRVRVISFDHTLAPLGFAVQNAIGLEYVVGWETTLQQLATERRVAKTIGNAHLEWTVCVGDFPTFAATEQAEALPKPHAILFDAFSPAKNPAMWTAPLFSRLYALLSAARACSMPTYSRSTMLRVSLLLAGFYVGVGHATGEKEETTIAANSLELIDEPLDKKWLERARRSTSAEPLWEPVYRQAPLSEPTLQRLCAHAQFAGANVG